jgi:hypothetical protein
VNDGDDNHAVEAAEPKQPYEAPRLRELGTLRELTGQGGPSGSFDDIPGAGTIGV